MSCTAREYLSTLDNFKGFPTKKDELWRFSKTDSWLDKSYKNKGSKPQQSSPLLETPYYICIKNGEYISSSKFDCFKITSVDGVELQSEENPFLNILSDINSKTIQIECLKGLDKPLLIHYLYGKGSTFGSSVNIIIGSDIKVDIIEHFDGGDSSLILHHTSILSKENSLCTHYFIQNLGEDCTFVSHVNQKLLKTASFQGFTLLCGTEFHQHFLESDLYEGSRNESRFLISSKESQNHLINTKFTHLQKGAKSVQKAKEILNGSSETLFCARSIIQKEAVRSDVRQENRALMLSADSRIYAKPHLEIFTDDLKASHGATVGELDIEALNYLQSRGIGRQKAKEMLIKAFVDDILESIENHELRGVVDKMLEKG